VIGVVESDSFLTRGAFFGFGRSSNVHPPTQFTNFYFVSFCSSWMHVLFMKFVYFGLAAYHTHALWRLERRLRIVGLRE
jgi:hypothetical protein